MRRIALYHLETLYWIDQLGSFRGAAERLNATQPAISARVREVEEQLGVDLFQRHGRHMRLNARGRQLVDACEPLRASIERALLEVSHYVGATGIVRIGAGEIIAASCLPAFVQGVERDLPGVKMEIDLDLTARMLQQLVAGTFDLAFVAGPVALPEIRTAPIGSLELCWVAGPALAAMGTAELFPIWSLPPLSPLHAITLDTAPPSKSPKRVLHTCSNVRALIEIVSGGLGAAVLPETMIRTELAAGRLVEIFPRPSRRIFFEVAIRREERDPVILELFDRAQLLQIDQAASAAQNAIQPGASKR